MEDKCSEIESIGSFIVHRDTWKSSTYCHGLDLRVIAFETMLALSDLCFSPGLWLNDWNPFSCLDFSRRRTVRTIHRVTTPPSRQSVIQNWAYSRRANCRHGEVCRLSYSSAFSVESGLGQIYLPPRPENMCGFLIEKGLDPTSPAFSGRKIGWILCLGRHAGRD